MLIVNDKLPAISYGAFSTNFYGFSLGVVYRANPLGALLADGPAIFVRYDMVVLRHLNHLSRSKLGSDRTSL